MMRFMAAPFSWKKKRVRGAKRRNDFDATAVLPGNSVPLRRMEHEMRNRHLLAVVATCLLSCGAPSPAPSEAPAVAAKHDRSVVARGAQLAAVGNCVSCHTAAGGKAYAGGYPLKTPF